MYKLQNFVTFTQLKVKAARKPKRKQQLAILLHFVYFDLTVIFFLIFRALRSLLLAWTFSQIAHPFYTRLVSLALTWSLSRTFSLKSHFWPVPLFHVSISIVSLPSHVRAALTRTLFSALLKLRKLFRLQLFLRAILFIFSFATVPRFLLPLFFATCAFV